MTSYNVDAASTDPRPRPTMRSFVYLLTQMASTNQGKHPVRREVEDDIQAPELEEELDNELKSTETERVKKGRPPEQQKMTEKDFPSDKAQHEEYARHSHTHLSNPFPSSSTHSISTFEGRPIDDGNLGLAMDSILTSIALRHRFQPDVAYEYWRATGSLQAVDEVLEVMIDGAYDVLEERRHGRKQVSK
ncbi:hypothetical protein QCA50_018074 [Cerrena zonata]